MQDYSNIMKNLRNKYENKKNARQLEKQSNIKNKTLILIIYFDYL